MTNRFDNFTDQAAEEAVIAELQQLARAHGSESRAADVITDKVMAGRFRFTPGLGWLAWDGRRWDTDDTAPELVLRAVREFIDTTERDYRAQTAEAAARVASIVDNITARVDDRDALDGMKPKDIVEQHGTADEADKYNAATALAGEAKKQADIWLNLLTASKMKSIVTLCRGSEGVLTRTSELDQQPDLLNCHNGVVDLRTGDIHPHNPDLLITKITAGDYDPNARNEQFDKALEAVHPDCRDWFQIRIGQSYTGYTPDDDSLIVSAGGGENGKSTLMVALRRAAGDYARMISHKVLLSTPGQHSTELMDLRGLRMALLEETEEEGRLDTHQLKTTIGTPQITARHMRQNTVTFDTSHTLWINTNFMPQVDSTDHGTWRRLKAMPWPFKFIKEWDTPAAPHEKPGDGALRPYLEYGTGFETAAISWAVAGAVRWYRSGRVMPRDPAPVDEASREWRSSSDVGYQFASERLIPDQHSFITADAMRTQFNEFLTAMGKREWSSQTLNTRLPDSMRSAGFPETSAPTKVSKIKESDKQSHPAGGDEWSRATSRDLPVGKAARVWRGVRFRTEDDPAPHSHLRAV